MIDINKGGLLYRIALYGTFFEEHKLMANGCPFIRRILFGLLLLTTYATLTALCLYSALTPIFQLFCVLFLDGYFEVIGNKAMVFGLMIWIVVAACSILYYVYDTDSGNKVRTNISTFTTEQWESTPIRTWEITQLLVAWHHKICPQLNFIGDKNDVYLDAFKDKEEQ